MQAFGGVGINALQDIFEVCPGIDLVLAAGGAKGHEDRRRVPAGLAADK